jgi:hypothetical protein
VLSSEHTDRSSRRADRESCGAKTSSLVRGANALIHAAVQWRGPRNRAGDNRGSPDLFFDRRVKQCDEFRKSRVEAAQHWSQIAGLPRGLRPRNNAQSPNDRSIAELR